MASWDVDSLSKSQVVADQSGLCKWIKKADGTIVVASKPSSLLAVEGDLKGGRARIVVAFLSSNGEMRIWIMKTYENLVI